MWPAHVRATTIGGWSPVIPNSIRPHKGFYGRMWGTEARGIPPADIRGYPCLENSTTPRASMLPARQLKKSQRTPSL